MSNSSLANGDFVVGGAAGAKEMARYLAGEKLTWKEQSLAKCFDCTNGYIDGRLDCMTFDCPMYERMPYKGKLAKSKKSDVSIEKQFKRDKKLWEKQRAENKEKIKELLNKAEEEE